MIVEPFYEKERKMSAFVPSSFNYNPVKDDKKRTPTWSIGSDCRFKNRGACGPGPGNYDLRSFISEGPKYSARVKPIVDPFKCKTRTGPADYNPLKSTISVKYSMGAKLETP